MDAPKFWSIEHVSSRRRREEMRKPSAKQILKVLRTSGFRV